MSSVEQARQEIIQHLKMHFRGAESDEEALLELAALGFERRLVDLYEAFQRGEISFGYIGEKLKMSAWEVEHLLAERGWRGTNL